MVRLVPEHFRDFHSRREVDRDQLMTVLANVTHLLIRANYNSAKMALDRCVLKRRENIGDLVLIIIYFKLDILYLIILGTQLTELSWNYFLSL